MSGQIIGLQEWFATPPGRYLLAWEQAQFDQAVADVFGYHALQLGAAQVGRLLRRRQRQPCLGDIGQDAAEADRHQQQRFELLGDGQPQEQQAHHQHHRLAQGQVVQPGAVP